MTNTIKFISALVSLGHTQSAANEFADTVRGAFAIVDQLKSGWTVVGIDEEMTGDELAFEIGDDMDFVIDAAAAKALDLPISANFDWCMGSVISRFKALRSQLDEIAAATPRLMVVAA